MRKYTKQQLKKLFSNLKHKRISDTMAHMLIDETYNEEPLLRTSGFYAPGAGDSVMTWDEATRTLLLEPVVPKAEQGETIYDINGDVYVPHFRFYVWERGPVLKRRYAYDAENSVLPNPDEIQIPAEEGLFAIYYDFNQDNRRYELTYTKAPDLDTVYEFYVDKVIVAWVYWDAANSEALYVGDSRHGSEWNPQMHWMLHQTINSQRQSGLALTNVTYDGEGDENGDYQFGISAGELWHDDIFAETDAVGTTESIPVWYFAGGLPRFLTPSLTKFLNTGTGRVAWNDIAGPAEATNNYFIAYHLFATNCTLYPHISVMGQAEHETLGAAIGSVEAEIATLRQTLPHSNLMHIGSFILQTNDDYTNSAKARIVYISNSIDTFTTDIDFNEVTRIFTLKQNNNKPDLHTLIPGDSELIQEKIETNNTTVIPQIINNSIGWFKESFLIEHTTLTEITQFSSWYVIAYNEVVGNFKAVVVIRNKTTHTTITLQNTFGFDFTDSANETDDDNAIISDGSITLVLSVDSATKLLKAVLTGMPADGKRIHFCFERCVLGERPKFMEAGGTFELDADAELTKYIDLVLAEPITFELGTAGVLQGDGNLSANISFTLNAEATLNETGIMTATVTMSLNVTATLTAFVPEPEFGLLYNFAVIENTNQVAPTGYRAATTQDVIDLITYLGGETAAGGPLKSLAEWTTPNTGATNASGFSALPAGYRDELGAFLAKLLKARIWIDNR